MLKSIREANDLKGKRVFVRVDWNVPLLDGEVRDDFRIKRSLQTFKFLNVSGAKIIAASHLEPESDSLAPIIDYVRKHYAEYIDGAEFLENLRHDPREKENAESFAKELAA